jgi:hypothetical protein
MCLPHKTFLTLDDSAKDKNSIHSIPNHSVSCRSDRKFDEAVHARWEAPSIRASPRPSRNVAIQCSEYGCLMRTILMAHASRPSQFCVPLFMTLSVHRTCFMLPFGTADGPQFYFTPAPAQPRSERDLNPSTR